MTNHPVLDPSAGMVTVWTVIVLLACVLMVGLVVDGDVVLQARSTTFDLAAGASRAGAQGLDQAALAKGEVRVDPVSAQLRVDDYLDGRGVTGTVVVHGDAVQVTVHRSIRLQILRPATVTVDESATAVATEDGGP
jgi:hypothetical protein